MYTLICDSNDNNNKPRHRSPIVRRTDTWEMAAASPCAANACVVECRSLLWNGMGVFFLVKMNILHIHMYTY